MDVLVRIDMRGITAHQFAEACKLSIDLGRKIVQPWLGDMKVRTWRERRPDIPLPRAYAF